VLFLHKDSCEAVVSIITGLDSFISVMCGELSSYLCPGFLAGECGLYHCVPGAYESHK
jgi:hypothetical protein